MIEQVMIYEIKSSADPNFKYLFSPNRKYFYWNDTFFKYLKVGDFVFVVNKYSHEVLFTKLDLTGLSVKVNDNKTTFSDLGVDFVVPGKWHTFIRLEIIKEITTKDNWGWKSLGNAEITYLNGKKINTDKSHNRIANIRQLQELTDDPTINEILDSSLKNFSASVSEKVEGLVVCDNTGWIDDAIMELNSHPTIALWWDKSPSGGDEVAKLLTETIEKSDEHCFYIYYTKDQIAYARARIVDFSFANNYADKNWNKNEDVAWFSSDFSNYRGTGKNGTDRIGRVVFLADVVEKLSSPINVTKFTFFKNHAPPTQNNMQPYSHINAKVSADLISLKSKLSVAEIIKHIHNYTINKGYNYRNEEIANFYLCLKAKPFVILAGISGTGKTQLPRKFAEAIGLKNQISQVPVRPDWTDGSDLLGYTTLDGRFQSKSLTEAIKAAVQSPKSPFFFILDEMNLARVEHYFSDFLSIIETREWENGKNSDIKTEPIFRKELLENATASPEYTKLSDLYWPKNLYLIGTVNMDETTHAFSKKVLDRANSIEMNEVDLNWLAPTDIAVNSLTGIDNSFFETEFLNSTDLSKTEKESIKKEVDLLIKINEILQKADLHFAYRVRDEVAFYLILNKKYQLLKDEIAVDYQLMQKILPRINGSSERVQTVLLELFNLLEGTNFSTNYDYSELEVRMKSGDLKYKRSSKKIASMLKRFDEDRFTSFWI